MKNKLLSLFLCLTTLFALLTPNIAIAGNIDETTEFVNYGANIGNTAKFNIDDYINFSITDNPETFNEDVDFEKDENLIYYYEEEDLVEFSSELLLVITNYYYNQETLALWYEVEAAPGYNLPEKLKSKSWVFHNYTDLLGYYDSLIIDDKPSSYIFDEEGNKITEVSMSYYDEPVLTCASTLQGKVDYQWQIYVNKSWVDIKGANEEDLNVNIGMLSEALNDNSVKVRCITKSGSKEVIGDEITISVTDNTNNIKMKTMVARNNDIMLTAEQGEEYCYVTIQYLFENGSEAANPFVAEVIKNGELNTTVSFPTVLGYLPHYNDSQINSMPLYFASVTEDITYTVIYQPTEVEYKIEVFFQNPEDDNYTFQSTETLYGLTGTTVPHLTISYEGMYELLHETPKIAANGSTILEVYFNRTYYLTKFDLDGGYGVYSIYARYGSQLSSHVGTPTKAGHTFIGWDDITDGNGDGIADVISETVPATNKIYKALWKDNPTAEVRIAFWGENPNDEEYSYIESKVLNVKPGTVLTYGQTGYICGLEEHQHDTGCTLLCNTEGHTHILEDCYELNCNKRHVHSEEGCTMNNCTHQTHTLDCYKTNNTRYPRLKKISNKPSSNATHLGDGIYSYTYSQNTTGYFLELDGEYYVAARNNNQSEDRTTRISLDCSHTHTDSCYDCGKATNNHVHSIDEGCYKLICDKHVHDITCYNCIEHTHSNACTIGTFKDYNSSLWTFVKSDPVTVKEDGSTVLNVYFDRKTFTMTFRQEKTGTFLDEIKDRKWGSDIRVEFNAISTANTFFWSEDEDGGSPWTSFIDVMPKKDMTYYADPQSGSSTITATYYGQKLDGSGYDVLYTVSFKGSSTITVSKEEFVDIEGYEFNDSLSTDIGKYYNGSTFYYDRANYTLEFYNGIDCDRTESMKYQESFSKFAGYVPSLPEEYEVGSREFKGWYLNPEFTGDPVDLTKLEMPAENMALYAKWEPVYHTVNIWKDNTLSESVLVEGEQLQPVLHGKTVFDDDFTLSIPENKPYTFVGWFYMDGENERMWDFESSVVVKDTDIYAKWSSQVLVPYTINFVVIDENGNKIPIADSISSSALAGTTVTFQAKANKELYKNDTNDYQSGYFPLTTSHSLTMNADKSEEGMTYDFIYVAKSKVPYTVRYLEKGTNKVLADPKVVEDNTYAIVTEKFKFIEKYSPDAFQKTLVIDGSDDAINEIIFYYTEDDTQSVYNVTHYIRSTNGVDYILYSTYGDIAKIGDTIPVEPLNLTGFTFQYALVNDTKVTLLDDGKINGEVVAKGLEIKVYYERNKYPYKIYYKDIDTLGDLASPDIIASGAYYGTGVYASDIETDKVGIDFDVYEVHSISPSPLTIRVETDNSNPVINVITVYYKEKTARINYEVVGDEGCGTVSPDYTDVKVINGTGATSKATANEGYVFAGWYSHESCNDEFLVTNHENLVLSKPTNSNWSAVTYYAKFVPAASDMTIVRKNVTEDNTQVFVYEVKNNVTQEKITVTITGNNSVTLYDMPSGNYTITQLNDWSWRYTDTSVTFDHQGTDGSTITYDNGHNTLLGWLNGHSPVVVNTGGN